MALEATKVEVAVVLGKARLPLERLLRLGRGALIALDQRPDDEVEILAGGHPVARGRVVIRDGRIAVEVTELLRRSSVTREPGARIGGGVLVGRPDMPALAA